MNKLLIITGPTATGKTSLGLKLAEKYDGEIISADSRQVYKYMDIGTGKDTDNFQWGIDLVEPGEDFSASNWVKYASKIINDIWAREKLPIIVGGTGLYIKELLNPSETLHIPPNEELRSKNYELKELQKILQEKDKNRWDLMNYSDRNNPRRLIRAIEVAGKIASSPTPRNDTDVLMVGLTASKEILFDRIDQRVEERIKMGIEEEKKILEKYKIPKTLSYYHGSTQEWKTAEHNYALRQLQYMQKFLPQTKWFDISQTQQVFAIVDSWYQAR